MPADLRLQIIARSRKRLISHGTLLAHDLFRKPASTFRDHALAPPEQAERPPHQEDDHHQIDENGADSRYVIFAGNIADAEHHGGGERAGDRAEPPTETTIKT